MEKSEQGIRRRAFQLREKGFTYALIEKQLGIPYAEAKQFGHEYDARHGKPRRIVRTLATDSPGSGPIRIPVRDLRNDSAAILRQVEAGRRFVITVAGREVAELGPVASRFATRAAVEEIIREAPLDGQFVRDVHTAVGDRIDDL
jgi:prevent-host-death family protein